MNTWINVIFANFSTHCQHVTTETRIHQSVWTFSHLTLMIQCLLLSHLILCCQAWCSTAVHLFQHAKSCLFWDALLHVSTERCYLQTCSPPVGWNKSCHSPLTFLITETFLPSWGNLAGCILALCMICWWTPGIVVSNNSSQHYCKPYLVYHICSNVWETRRQMLLYKAQGMTGWFDEFFDDYNGIWPNHTHTDNADCLFI